MADLVKIYEDMITKLQAARDAAATPGIAAGIDELIEGAQENLRNAQADNK